MTATEPAISHDEVDLDGVLHVIDQHSDVLFTWDYERSRPALVKLYEKAKTSQWNASTDLDWSTAVDLEKIVAESQAAFADVDPLRTDPDSPLRSWSEAQWIEFGINMQTYALSQFLHGEQGALICTGLITATVPWIDAKYYAATQVMDEARHVEVFAATSRRRWAARSRSTPTSAGCSTTSWPTAGGTSPTSACRSWWRASPWRRSGSCRPSPPSRCSSSCSAT
ncbi:MAG: ferritin-like domain-containing protein [Acidimicrobiales bacterium]